jgi:hypothetical protein
VWANILVPEILRLCQTKVLTAKEVATVSGDLISLSSEQKHQFLL